MYDTRSISLGFYYLDLPVRTFSMVVPCAPQMLLPLLQPISATSYDGVLSYFVVLFILFAVFLLL